MGYMRCRWAALAMALAAAACEPGEIVPPIDSTSAVELGTGDQFEPLDDDAPLDVVLGIQGGYHVVGNALISGYIPQPVLGGGGDEIRFELIAYDGIPLNIDSGAIQTGLQQNPDGTYTCAPGHHVLVGVEPAELDGTPAEFRVLMPDAEGEMMIDSRRVVLRFPPP
jgi:hypothetical protein